MKVLCCFFITLFFLILLSLPAAAQYPVPLQTTANSITPYIYSELQYACQEIAIPEGSYPLGFKIDSWDDNSGNQVMGPGTYEIKDGNGKLVGTITYTDMYMLDDGRWAFDWESQDGTYTGVIAVKAGNQGNLIYEYTGTNANSEGDKWLYAPQNYAEKWAKISHFTFCGYFTPKPQCSTASITVNKFYDANANGKNDDGQLIDGWKVNVAGINATTPANMDFAFGSYTISEYNPVQTSWMSTTPKSVDVTLNACNEKKSVEFGNLCLGPGGGYTLGFWSNPNGAKLIGSDDLNMLRNLYLKNANGNEFDPIDYSSLRTGLLKAQATNMAYMLSAQLAAMELNVFNGKVNGNSIIYAPGVSSANSLGFTSVNSVMAEADAALKNDGFTPAGDPNRIVQQSLKDALDNANNNYNFVQPSPCPFTFL